MNVLFYINQKAAFVRGLEAPHSSARIEIRPDRLTEEERQFLTGCLDGELRIYRQINTLIAATEDAAIAEIKEACAAAKEREEADARMRREEREERAKQIAEQEARELAAVAEYEATGVLPGVNCYPITNRYRDAVKDRDRKDREEKDRKKAEERALQVATVRAFDPNLAERFEGGFASGEALEEAALKHLTRAYPDAILWERWTGEDDKPELNAAQWDEFKSFEAPEGVKKRPLRVWMWTQDPENPNSDEDGDVRIYRKGIELDWQEGGFHVIILVPFKDQS